MYYIVVSAFTIAMRPYYIENDAVKLAHIANKYFVAGRWNPGEQS